MDSIKAAAARVNDEVEIVVALNRCTDRTEEIARSYGARFVREDAKNLSIIRNAAVRASRGNMVITIDADSRMSENALELIHARLSGGRTVGGGVWLQPERLSLGIIVTSLFIAAYLLLVMRAWITGGLFWFSREAFDKIGGFDEKMLTAEDVDFALRLRRLGREEGKPFTNLFKVKIITSCRKFDQFGEWYMIRNPFRMVRMALGRDKESADRFWYDVKR